MFGIGVVKGNDEFGHNSSFKNRGCESGTEDRSESGCQIEGAQSVVGLVEIIVHDPGIEPVRLPDFLFRVGETAGDAGLVVRAPGAEETTQKFATFAGITSECAKRAAGQGQ